MLRNNKQLNAEFWEFVYFAKKSNSASTNTLPLTYGSIKDAREF